MNQIPDLSNEVVVRALKSVTGEIPGALHSELTALVPGGGIYNGQMIAAAITKIVNMSVPNAN